MRFKSKTRDNPSTLPVADRCLAVAGLWRRWWRGRVRVAIAGYREWYSEQTTGPEKITMKKRAHILAALAGLMVSSTAMAALPLQDDVDRNEQSDILFTGGTALAYWALSPNDNYDDLQPKATSHYAGDGGPGYRVVAVSDFDGDRSADVLWSNGTQLKMWINDGSGRYTPALVGSYGNGWEPFAARDINADRKSAILFRKGSALAYWLMDGATVLRENHFGDGGPGYRVIALDDFDKDRVADVLWTNGSQLKVWLSRAGHATTMIGSYGGGWEAFAAGDINNDGIADILFRGDSHLAYWLMDANAQVRGSFYGGDGGAGFRVIGVSAYDNYALGTILWGDGSNLKLWLLHSTRGFYPIPVGTYGGGWQPLSMLIPQ